MQLLKKPQGFTLMELLVAMGIGMVVLAAVTSTYMSQLKFYNAQEQVNEMQQNALGTLDLISREVKMAGYKPNSGAVTGVNLDSTQLVIEADLDSNSSIDGLAGSLEKISYAFNLSNNQITRKLGAGNADVFAHNISDFTFTFLRADGVTPATLASEIRQVKIDVTARTAQPDPANGGYRTYQVSLTITPPNLAY